MSERSERVTDLVIELQGLRAQVAAKEQELESLVDGVQAPKPKPAARKRGRPRKVEAAHVNGVRLVTSPRARKDGRKNHIFPNSVQGQIRTWILNHPGTFNTANIKEAFPKIGGRASVAVSQINAAGQLPGLKMLGHGEYSYTPGQP